MTRNLLIGLILCISAISAGSAFRQVQPGYEYSFPRDHFEHPEFLSEWWYYTGNLFTAGGRRFGFELTFFRQAAEDAKPGKPESASDANPWKIRHLYLAHFALTDLDAGRFYHTERLNRAGPGLAGASLEEELIWNGNWQVEWAEPQNPLGVQKLRADAGDFSLELTLTPAKPPVIHGENGVSWKARPQEAGSHYVSFTRLKAEGEVRAGGATHQAAGTAWMDHEFFTSGLGEEQTGWDWMSIQLDNQSELMLYRLRARPGSGEGYLSGTFADPEGNSLHLAGQDIELVPGRTWTSPHTGATYPIAWTIGVPRLELELEASTELPDQELVSERGMSPNYWEGAMNYEGTMGGQRVRGVGYLEMTGYDRPMNLGRSND